MAYPVYMTIGNILKDICCKPSCCAQILIGYIPITSFQGITNKAAHCCTQANLFHACMEILLAPITPYSETSIAIMTADGLWCRCHPIFAMFVSDYPKQGLVTYTYFGHCLKCEAPWDRIGKYQKFLSCAHTEAINLYHLADSDVSQFHKACWESGLKPIYHPFWQYLPFTDIYQSITPDILHQLL